MANLQCNILLVVGAINLLLAQSLGGAADISNNPSLTLSTRPQCIIGQTLRLAIGRMEPYAMLKDSNSKGHSLEDFEGILIDILRDIFLLCNVTYVMISPRDSMHGGVPDENGTWNGLIGHLLRNETDLAATVSINYERAQVVDFTAPFSFDGISVLIVKPDEIAPTLFTFLTPLTGRTWALTFVVLLIFALSLCLISALPQHSTLTTKFTCGDSLWYIVACFLCQSAGMEPRSLSTRILCVTSWAFTLIVITCYAGNLTAFLTVSRMSVPISSFADLVQQTKYEYGTIFASSTASFFKNAEGDVFHKMRAYMLAKPEVMVNEFKEGVERAKTGRYAFIGPSTALEFETKRNCNLMMIGRRIGTSPVAFATQKGAPFKNQISDAILYLQKSSKFDTFRDQWFTTTAGLSKCEENSIKGSSALDIDNFGGLYVVAAVGLGVAYVTAMAEFLVHTWNNSRSVLDDEKKSAEKRDVTDEKKSTEHREMRPNFDGLFAHSTNQ